MIDNKVIGVIGGGQLGKMFIEEALRFNVECIIVDADKNCPASVIANHQIIGSITEAAPLLQLAERCDVLTYEIEHIYIDALFEIEKKGKKLIPSASILQMIQDKGLQKKYYAENKIPTADFEIVNSAEEWIPVLKRKQWKKFVAKLCKDGYDGKGVQIMNAEDVLNNPLLIPFTSSTVLEEFISCETELAVIVARNEKGEIKCFPAVEMEFDAEANLVTMLVFPARLNNEILEAAQKIAAQVVVAMNGVGVFAVEMFVGIDGKIIVNETAPRPHNSGHHTIEACYTSQYEQLLRIILGLPLGSTEIIKPSVMINILGNKNFNGSYFLDGMNEALAIEGVYIHMYGKKENKPMRKLGHVTILANTVEEAIEKAKTVQSVLKIKQI